MDGGRPEGPDAGDTPEGPGGGGCAYRLVSHAVYTCVSKTAYNLAGAGIQRIAAGIFLSFYVMHLYAALASARPAHRAGNGPIAEPESCAWLSHRRWAAPPLGPVTNRGRACKVRASALERAAGFAGRT
jgi:hypothetical protein